MGTNLYLVLWEPFFSSKSKHSLFFLSFVAKENRLNKYGGSVRCLGRWIGLVIPCADRRNCLEKKIEAEGEKGKGQLGNEKNFTSAYNVKVQFNFYRIVGPLEFLTLDRYDVFAFYNITLLCSFFCRPLAQLRLNEPALTLYRQFVCKYVV